MATSARFGVEEILSRVSFPRIFWHVRLPQLLIAVCCLLMLADFIGRGMLLAFSPGKTDFTEIYTGAWLWRHGQNFYDSTLATKTAEQLTGTSAVEAIVYPPSALAAFTPFTFLTWGWANFLCLFLALISILITIQLLIRIGKFRLWEQSTLLLIAFILIFDPVHQAFHLGNIALLVVPLALGSIHLAETRRDLAAGMLISFATLLKPQIGIWVLIFYVIQRRVWIVVGATLPALAFAFALWRYPVRLATLVSGYRQNLQHHFGVGGHLGFTKGALPFHVNIFQVILYQLWPNVTGVSLLAHAIFVCGLAVWAFALWRARFRVPVPLAISSLIALSFISLYHSVSDVVVLTLALCWAIRKEGEEQTWSWQRRLTCVILVIMLLPGHSVLMRATPHLAASITTAWWWNLFVARYFVWLLFAFNIVLLSALVTAGASEKTAVVHGSMVSDPSEAMNHVGCRTA